MADKTADEIAKDFTAMGHSVSLINDVIAGNSMADEEAAERQAAVESYEKRRWYYINLD